MYENNFFVAKQNFSWKRDSWAARRHGIYFNNIRLYETFLSYENGKGATQAGECRVWGGDVHSILSLSCIGGKWGFLSLLRSIA